MTNPIFSFRMKHLFSLLTNETKLKYYDRILMYKDLLELTTDLELKDLNTSIITSLNSYYREIVLRNNNYELNIMYTVLEKWIPKMRKTLYSDPENVHVFSSEAVKVATKIIAHHPQKYHRPHNEIFDSQIAHTYFELIENDISYNGIKLTDLFASIWDYISTHELYSYFLQRLLQEIEDSIDVCTSGRFVRLVNVINGVDEKYKFFVKQQEYNQSYIFHLLNKRVNMLDLENFEKNVELCINTDVDLIKVTRSNEIQKEDVIQILQNYTKTNWTYSYMTDSFTCL